jgi:peptidoglycan hydrolase CwlO-like protein
LRELEKDSSSKLKEKDEEIKRLKNLLDERNNKINEYEKNISELSKLNVFSNQSFFFLFIMVLVIICL